MLIALLVFVATVAALNWIANPYKAWHAPLAGGKYWGGRFAWEVPDVRIVTPYRVRTEQPTTLLVGSSRVLWGMPIYHGYSDGILNAALPGASLAEIAAILRLAAASPRLKRVVWGVDYYPFEESYPDFPNLDTQLRLEGAPRLLSVQTLMKIKETLLSAEALHESRKILLRSAGALASPRPMPAGTPAPWPEELIKERLDGPRQAEGLEALDESGLKRGVASWVSTAREYRLSAARLSLFHAAVTGVTQAGMDLILFVPPLSACDMEAIKQTGRWPTFMRWKRELAGIAPYWDYSGSGALEDAESFFQDVPHMKGAVGHAILRQLLGMGCTRCGERAQGILHAALWVSEETADRQLADQEALRTVPAGQASRCARAVKDVVRAAAVDATNYP